VFFVMNDDVLCHTAVCGLKHVSESLIICRVEERRMVGDIAGARFACRTLTGSASNDDH
jgi:hypothetical protein